MARVLIVDDDPITLELLKVTLTLAGHDVAALQDPLRCEEFLGKHQPEAIILDILLPGTSGYALLKLLRDHPKYKNVPVLLLTGRASLKDRVQGLKSSADDYLGKPFDPEELTLRLEKLLAVRKRHGASASIQGFLEVYSLPDLLQVLQRDRRTGELVLGRQNNAAGFILLRDGKIVSAECGPLVGDDALLELIDHTDGEFSFDIKADDEVETSFPPSLSLQNLLLLDAHFRDEISRISTESMDWKSRWWLHGDREPIQPGDLPDLPLSTILDSLRKNPGSSFVEISKFCGLATVRVGLSLLSLQKQGLITHRSWLATTQ